MYQTCTIKGNFPCGFKKQFTFAFDSTDLFKRADSSTLDCTFDSGFCNWKNSKADCFDWAIGDGDTVDKTSGPSIDHTTRCMYTATYSHR